MHKKILILGVTFDETFGVGVTLKNLFSQISSNDIGIVDYSVTTRDFKYAGRLFDMNVNAEIIKEPTGTESGEIIKSLNKEKTKVKYFKLIARAIRKYLVYYYNNYIPCRITPNLKKFIVDFDPDFLYVIPYKGRLVHLALRLNNLYDIPIVTHFMDDFRKRSPWDVFYYLNECLTRQRIFRITARSYRCLAICDSMASEYEKILNKKFHPFHNPINIELFKKHKFNSEGKTVRNFRICYTGTIAENNVDTLVAFSNGCELLETKETQLQFDIYSPVNESNPFYRRLIKSIKGYKRTTFKGKISHDEIISVLFKYDLLLLPLSFKKKYLSVIEFSFPTKVSEYMASGIPTLYIVPPAIALHDYITKNKIGFLIDRLDSSRIETFLKAFIQDANMQKEDVRAKEIAYASFHINDVAENFEKIFS
jgi:hypothetical protein